MPRSIPSPQRQKFLSSRYYGNAHAIKQSGCLAKLIKKCTRLCMSCNYISHTRHPSKSYDHAGRALPAEKKNSLYSCEKKREICVLHGDPGAGNLGRQKTSQEAAYHIELTLVLLFFSIWSMHNLTTAEKCKWETTHKETTSLVTLKVERPRTLQLRCASCLASAYHWMQYAISPTICKT